MPLKGRHLSESLKIVEFSTIPEIPLGISNGTEIPVIQFSKIWVNLAKCPLFKSSGKRFSIRQKKFPEIEI